MPSPASLYNFLNLNNKTNRAYSTGKRNIAGNGITSQDQLLSQSTDEQEDYTWVFVMPLLYLIKKIIKIKIII